MDRKKIENIIIIILVLLNLFLLSVTLADRAQERRARRETVQTVTKLLAADGISVSDDAALLPETPAKCTVVRDFETELARMTTIIGSTEPIDLGGSIRFYKTDRGQAVLRGTGEVDLLLTGGNAKLKGSAEKTAVKLLADAGVESMVWDGDPGDSDFTCCCLWNGIPVYNARLGFDCSGDYLSMMSGTIVLHRETERSTEGVMDAVSALMRFAEIVRSEGFICSRLDALEPGYIMSVTVSGESTLTPVWHIRTDTGDLYINAMTGKTEKIA